MTDIPSGNISSATNGNSEPNRTFGSSILPPSNSNNGQNIPTSASTTALNFMRRPVYSTAAQPINTSLYPITQQLPPITNTKRKRRKQRLFQKDIENLLFAMGDRPVSTDLTVQALEEILVEYLTDLSRDILAYARSQGRNRIKMNDLMFALRNDPLKLARYQYTIEQSQRIERAKKLFEENDVSEAQVHAQNSSAEEEEEEEEEDRGLTKAGKKRKYKKKKRKVTGNVMFKSDEE